MTSRYRVIGYSRFTERAEMTKDVPHRVLAHVLTLAGIAAADEPGETPLSDEQARDIGNVASFHVDPSRFVYHLEALAPAQGKVLE